MIKHIAISILAVLGGFSLPFIFQGCNKHSTPTTDLSAREAALVHAKYLQLKNPAARCFISNDVPKLCSLSYENSNDSRTVLKLYCYYDDCYLACK